MEAIQENPQKSISDRLKEVLGTLSVDQMRFVAAMQHTASKKEAAEAVGLEPNTVYKWPKIVDEAILIAAKQREESAREMASKYLLKAMNVKVGALDSEDEVLRQRAATEIIEWNLGKATQKQEVTGKDGGPIELTDTERAKRLDFLLNAARTRRSRADSEGGGGDGGE